MLYFQLVITTTTTIIIFYKPLESPFLIDDRTIENHGHVDIIRSDSHSLDNVASELFHKVPVVTVIVTREGIVVTETMRDVQQENHINRVAACLQFGTESYNN